MLGREGRKLKVDLQATGDVTVARISGEVTGGGELEPLARVRCRRLVLDMEELTRFNSAGVQSWLRTIRALTEGCQNIEIINAGTEVLGQCSMIAGFVGTATFTSIRLDFVCTNCDETERHLLHREHHFPEGTLDALPTLPCKSCGGSAHADTLMIPSSL